MTENTTTRVQRENSPYVGIKTVAPWGFHEALDAMWKALEELEESSTMAEIQGDGRSVARLRLGLLG